MCNKYKINYEIKCIRIRLHDLKRQQSCTLYRDFDCTPVEMQQNHVCLTVCWHHMARKYKTWSRLTGFLFSWVESDRALWSLLRPDSTQLRINSECSELGKTRKPVELSWVGSGAMITALHCYRDKQTDQRRAIYKNTWLGKDYTDYSYHTRMKLMKNTAHG